MKKYLTFTDTTAKKALTIVDVKTHFTPVKLSINFIHFQILQIIIFLKTIKLKEFFYNCSTKYIEKCLTVT